LIHVTVRKPLAQITGDDALNPLVDLFDAFLGAHAQPPAGQQTKTKARQETERERLTDDVRDFAGLIDLSAKDEHVTVSHAPTDRADDLGFAAVAIHPDDVRALRRGVDPKMRRQAFQIAGNPVAVGGKYRRDLYPSRILSQLLVYCLEPAFRRQAGDAVQFHGDPPVR